MCLRIQFASIEGSGFLLSFFLIFFRGIFIFLFIFLSSYIQHCLICRSSDSTMPTDAGIEPRTVATGALTVRPSNHQARSHSHQARSHSPRLDLITFLKIKVMQPNFILYTCLPFYLLFFFSTDLTLQSANFQTLKEPKNQYQGTNSAKLFSMAGRYDNPIPTRFLAPIDCLKIVPAKGKF